LGLFFITAIIDMLIGSGIIVFLYTYEYSFFFLIVMMDFAMQRNIVSLFGEVETLNATLEDKVSNRTEEITRLLGALSTKIAEVLTNSSRDYDTKARYATADAPSIRLYDVPGRYGGDEFAVILPYCREAEVLIVAERIRERIDEIAMPDLPEIRIGASIGGAVYDPGTCGKMSDADFMRKADGALYAAKTSGRGKTIIAPRSTSAEKGFREYPYRIDRLSALINLTNRRQRASNRSPPQNTKGRPKTAFRKWLRIY
jgi:hypothetical protein